MKYFLLAGEASGDLHAAHLVQAIRTNDSQAAICGWGGNLMGMQGVRVLKHYRDLAFMGFIEVLRNLNTILANFKLCKKQIEQFAPDVVILVDYPGFNLRLLPWLKKKGYKVVYYIAPQIWAWDTKRIHNLVQHTDRVICILPFEQAFYKQHGYNVSYIGHPLLDVIASHQKVAITTEHPTIALLPGSRKQEIARVLPVMLQVIPYFPQYEFIIASAPALDETFYQPIIGNTQRVKLVFGHTYDVMVSAQAALVTSGTATLETALFNVPQVVCYKGGNISFQIARRVVKVPFISLVNLIAERKIVDELIQSQLNVHTLRAALAQVLKPEVSLQMQADYAVLRLKLGNGGAAHRAADIIHTLLHP